MLSDLPFRDDSFDLALYSHLPFYYSLHLTGSFHHDAIREMLRVSPEVRIVPHVDPNGTVSSLLHLFVCILEENGCLVEIRSVEYEFIKGGNRVMVVTRGD